MNILKKISLSIIVLFIANVIVAQPIKYCYVYPKQALAGTVFSMEIYIQKYTLATFAQFNQKLPKGFTAKDESMNYANFYFDNQIVTYLWWRLPSQEQLLKLKYDILIDQSVKEDTFELPGYFTYQYDNKLGYVEAENPKIFVKKMGTPLNQIDTTKIACSEFYKQTDKNLCTREQKLLSNKVVLVTITVDNPQLKGIGLVQENVPDEYDAVPDSLSNSTFSFKNNIASFYWNEIPEKQQIKVSYKLIRKKVDPIMDLPIIFGKFINIINSKSYEYQIIQNPDLK